MASKQKDVRLGHSLNDAETHYVNSRKKTVADALRVQGVDCTEDEVPNIALMSTGNGTEAMWALLLSLLNLERMGLLDAITYLSGSSEATWLMAFLYKIPAWSKYLTSILENYTDYFPDDEVTLEMQYEKLKKYYQEENFSFTHVWAVVISKILLQIDEDVLTEQRNKHDADPYPIFNVVDDKDRISPFCNESWFEITPDESGYSLGGAFVDTAFLGSEYENGKRTKRCLEEDMLYLQGLCTGGAFADTSEILQMITELLELINGADAEEKEQFTLIKALVNLHSASSNEKKDHLKIIKNILQDEKYAASGLQDAILKLENEMNEEDIKELILRVLELLREHLGVGAEQLMIIRILILLIHRTWGTTNNIVYDLDACDIDPSIPRTKTRHYVDARLYDYLPHLSLLRKERKVDILIIFEDNERSFENVKKTAEVCKKMNIPFPEVPTDESGLKDFYVLKGIPALGDPSVIYLSLFESEGEIKEWKKKFSSTKTLRDRNMITALKEKAASNVSSNKDILLNEIKLFVEQRKKNSN